TMDSRRSRSRTETNERISMDLVELKLTPPGRNEPNRAPTQLPVLDDRAPRVRPPLPASRAEMEARGWDAVDVVFVTGDAYVDHPSFANGILPRVLEAAGYRVAVLAQP